MQGLTPIHWAVLLGRADLVELLLSSGATVHAKSMQARQTHSLARSLARSPILLTTLRTVLHNSLHQVLFWKSAKQQ